MATKMLNLNCISDGTFKEALVLHSASKDCKMYVV
nr:MAG TPA: hypothetical protein [Caudoviricetes sp.]